MRSVFGNGLLRVVLAAMALVVAFAGVAHAQLFSPRSKRGYRREMRRIRTVPRIKSLADKLASSSPLTRQVKVHGDSWSFGEGPKRFNVEIAKGCRVEGLAHRYQFGGVASDVTKLKKLELVNASGKRVSILGDHNVNLGNSTHYWKKVVTWHGPISRLSMLAFFHELGHAKELARATPAQKDHFERIYNYKDAGKRLSGHDKRMMIGFERRAWASALIEVRKLRSQGFDLLAGVDRKELFQTIYGCMKGYYDYKGDANPKAPNTGDISKLLRAASVGK